MITEAKIREKLDQISVHLDLIRTNLATGEQNSLLPDLGRWSTELYSLLLDPNATIKNEELIKWLSGKESLLDKL